MPGITSSLSGTMLVPVRSAAQWISLHNGDPAATGANEQAISPYGRSPTSWAAPSSGKLVISNPINIAVNAASSVGFYGLWDQRTLGTFLAGSSLSAVEIFAAPGTYTVSSLNFTLPLTS